MAMIVLQPNDVVLVRFADSDGELIDGELSISFGQKSIKIETDWPDSSNRQGVIYEEKFGGPTLDMSDLVIPERPDPL